MNQKTIYLYPNQIDMARVFSLIFFLFSITSLVGQELSQKRLVKTDSFKLEFYVVEKQKVYSRLNDSLHYHWYKSQKMYITQGGVDGEVINGVFKKFYLTGQLAEKGQLYFGLKQGKWRTWHSNGNLKTIIEYRRGKKHGNVSRYDKDGTLIGASEYKNDYIKEERNRILNLILEKKSADNNKGSEKEKNRKKKESSSEEKLDKKEVKLKDRFSKISKS